MSHTLTPSSRSFRREMRAKVVGDSADADGGCGRVCVCLAGRSWRRGSNQSQSQGIGAGRGGMEPAHSGSEADETEEGGSDDEEELEDDLVRERPGRP